MVKITDERRSELEASKLAKKHAELEGFDWVRHGHSGGGNLCVPRVVPIAHGKALAVYPDEATLAAMKAEGWTRVTVGFRQNEAGELAELALRKGDNGSGINIRHYDQQRTNIHVSIRHRGKAVAKPNASACSLRRVEDAFVFDVLSQISIES